MSHRLLLAIDEQWPTRPDCPWVLLGPDGQPTAEGHSEPRHWPAAAECEVVLTGPQCLWLEVPLPRAKRSDLPRLLAYALEDRLLKDPDTQHLTVSHRRPAGDGERELTGVLVVARERLRQYGISPPQGHACHADMPAEVSCPRCGSTHTSLISEFGSTACKALYRCDSCREPFDYFKCI